MSTNNWPTPRYETPPFTLSVDEQRLLLEVLSDKDRLDEPLGSLANRLGEYERDRRRP